MDITGIFSRDKERILNEKYHNFLAPQKNCIQKTKRADLYSFICATISIIACIFACTCTIYCYRILAEIRANRILCEAQYRISTPEQNDLTSAYSDSNDVEYHGKADDSEFDNQTDDSDDNKNIITQLETDDLSVDLSEDSSSKKKLSRLRRGTKQEIRMCKKNCKGKGAVRRKCRRECNKKASTSIQRIKTNSQINLPAAHFQANMRDGPTRNLVDTLYNDIKRPGEGPLKIFKQASWVGNSSPVHFSKDSVATAKSSGIFLVYAQVYIGGKEPEKSITVIQKRCQTEISALSCDNGVNSRHASEQYQTCSVFGLMKLETDDTIEIQRSDVTVKISLDEDKTFFGLVQLSGIAPNV